MSFNDYAFVTIHIIVLYIHQSYMKLSCHYMYKYLHFHVIHIRVHLLSTLTCVYEDYHIVEIQYNKKSLYNTYLMNFWPQLLKYMLTAAELLVIRWHFWAHVISFLLCSSMCSFCSINFPRHPIKLAHYMSVADREKTMLVYSI